MTNLVLKFSLNLLLLLIEVIGDRIQRLENLDLNIKAVVDSGTHGLIAGVSWLLTLDDRIPSTIKQSTVFETLLCATLGCLVDIDHFIAAHSLKLKDVMNLPRRPFLHSSSLLVTTVSSLYLVASILNSSTLTKVSSIILVAWLSHQIRDGIRRGLWFPPFGSTSPIPYWAYLVSTAGVPHLVRWFLFPRNVTEHGLYII